MKKALTIAALLVAAAIAVGVAPTLVRQRAARCNVLIITLDTTRADRIGCYGHASAETPTRSRMCR